MMQPYVFELLNVYVNLHVQCNFSDILLAEGLDTRSNSSLILLTLMIMKTHTKAHLYLRHSEILFITTTNFDNKNIYTLHHLVCGVVSYAQRNLTVD